jgi:hypothetical protein
MDNTGNFDDGSITSILILDTNTEQYAFQAFSDKFLGEIESNTDSILDFTPKNFEMRKKLPKIDLKAKHPLVDYWQSPFVKQIRKELMHLSENLGEAFHKHSMKKDLKIVEDPWDNYILHDSKIFLPILNHQVCN